MWALSLCPTARAAEIRFAPSLPAADAARWESLSRETWSAWERRFGVSVEAPPLTISLADPAAVPADFGRARGSRIELHPRLSRDAADSVFVHELAHVFVESRCAGLAAGAPLLSEAFALFVSGDAARRSFEGTRFLYASSARDWLLAHAGETRGDSRLAQQALSRVLAQPEMEQDWDACFRRLLRSCGSPSFALAGALADLLDTIRGLKAQRPLSRTDFFLIDGLSGETLAEEGQPQSRQPVGSILKPSLVAALPALMEPREARDAAEWHCPGRPLAGESFSWQRALATSCNGYFLDFAAASPAAFEAWDEEMRRLGVHLPENLTGMDERIGLREGITLSPVEAVRLFCWLDRKAPFVVDALRRTARDGTLASAPEAGWFVERGIALKTGTVRGAASEPLHGWIVAVGPRDASGTPAFVAAIHATGRATVSLLPELKRRLASSLTGLERLAEVQILGLVPETGVGLACGDGAPLLVRGRTGLWRLERPGAAVRPGALAEGETYACPAAALVVSFDDGHGQVRRRRYFGALSVASGRSGDAPSSVPLRERSARARRGSRFILATSERSYVTSSILSELPEGPLELQAALSLVVRNNRLADRHGERPPCDTTHCSLFGQDGNAPAAARRRAARAVALAAAYEIEAPENGRVWFPFSLGGEGEWTQVRTRAQVAEALGLPEAPENLARAGRGDFVIGPSGQRLACEIVRNQLRLPSCPDEVLQSPGQFTFCGKGEGHGEGLDLTRAAAVAALGADFRSLLAQAWPELILVRRSDSSH